MFEVERHDKAALNLAATTNEAVRALLWHGFGTAWAVGPYPADREPDTIARVRHDLVLPAYSGGLQALAQFAWMTAPPGGTMEQLLQHLHGNVAIAGGQVTGPAGHFWLNTFNHKEPANG